MARVYEKSFHRDLFGNAKKEDFRPPIFLCKSCTYCEKNWCNLLNRHVLDDYNRCTNHSNYTVLKISFKNIDERYRQSA